MPTEPLQTSLNQGDGLGQDQLDFKRVKQQRQRYKALIWYCLAIAAAFIALGAGLGLSLYDKEMSKHCPEPCAAAQGDEGCFTGRPFFGIVLLVYLVPIGVLALGACIVEFSQRVRCSNVINGGIPIRRRRPMLAVPRQSSAFGSCFLRA